MPASTILVLESADAGAQSLAPILTTSGYTVTQTTDPNEAIAKVEKARAEGLKITADMYTYTAGATGLDAAMPPWVLDGGYEEAYKRFKDPLTRKKIARAITTPSQDWENLYLAAGSPDRVLLVDFKSEALKPRQIAVRAG